LSDLDVCFAEALAYTASLTPGVYTTFQRHLDPSWIEEALATTCPSARDTLRRLETHNFPR
jgi:hypothetical protein